MAPKADTAAPSATNSSETHKPPPEKPSETNRRSYIILSYWLIVLFLGLPIWWKTTAIYRASLPLDGMIQWSEGKVSGIKHGKCVENIEQL